MFEAEARKYVAAVLADGTYVGKTGLIPGLEKRPVRPGDVVLLFGTGFGPTDPAQPAATVIAQPAKLRSSVTVRIGGVAAQVVFAGLVSSGLNQFNAIIPDVPDGDQAVVLEIGGVQSQAWA